MYTGLTHLHSTLRYILLFFLVFSVVTALLNRGSNTSKGQKRIYLLTFIFTHLQLLVGLILYFVSPWVKSVLNDFSVISQNAVSRFFALEHAVVMLISVMFITMGWKKFKKASADKQNTAILIFYGIALILIFLMIPWPFLRDFGSWF